VSLSVISVVSAGAHPVNSAATWAVAAAGPARSMLAIHSCDLEQLLTVLGCRGRRRFHWCRLRRFRHSGLIPALTQAST
jgi:hypothetical protein